MTYVEWLRVRNLLRVVGIFLGACLLVALLLRISFNSSLSSDRAFLAHIKMQAGSQTREVVLPDGTHRTIITDPRDKTVATIDNTGYGGRHIVITQPASAAHHHSDHVTIGSVHVIESAKNGMSTTVVDTNGAVPFALYMAFADLVALMLATLLAAPFARENDGHLEIALTKPVSRTTYGMAIMGVDILGIAIASAMTVLTLLIAQAMFEVPHIDFSGINADAIAIGLSLPLAWYALLTAVTASMKRGYGAVLGFAWPVMLAIVGLSVLPLGNSMLGIAVHNIFWIISRADPLTYAHLASPGEVDGTSKSAALPGYPLRFAIEILLFVIYGALALVQWRRVEA